MARKSRKQIIATQLETSVSVAEYKVYRTALYARLSADEHCRAEGTTIDNQLYLLRESLQIKSQAEIDEL